MSINAVDQHRALQPALLPALLLVGVASFAAFPSHASDGGWSDGVSHDQSFSRILVVGISPEFNQRCSFERSLASKIKSANTVAIVSCSVIPQDTELTRESVEAAVAASNADAVLTTSLISKSWEDQQGGHRDSQGAALYKPIDSYYGYYGTVVAAEFHTAKPITTAEGAAHVTTKLFETRGATVVYTIDTKVKKIESRAEGIAAVSDPIVQKLRKERLIR